MEILTESAETILSKIKPGNRTLVERMAMIYVELKRNRQVTCTSLAAKIEVSSRTISRDIEFLRDRLHLPIEWDSQLGTYVYGGAK